MSEQLDDRAATPRRPLGRRPATAARAAGDRRRRDRPGRHRPRHARGRLLPADRPRRRPAGHRRARVPGAPSDSSLSRGVQLGDAGNQVTDEGATHGCWPGGCGPGQVGRADRGRLKRRDHQLDDRWRPLRPGRPGAVPEPGPLDQPADLGDPPRPRSKQPADAGDARHRRQRPAALRSAPTSPACAAAPTALQPTIERRCGGGSPAGCRAVAGPQTVLAVSTTYDPFVALVRTGTAVRPARRAMHRFVTGTLNPRIGPDLPPRGLADRRPRLRDARRRPPRRAVVAAGAGGLRHYSGTRCARADIHLNADGYALAARSFDPRHLPLAGRARRALTPDRSAADRLEGDRPPLRSPRWPPPPPRRPPRSSR